MNQTTAKDTKKTTPPFDDIHQAVEKYDTIIIQRHQRPDPDALGSQLGLKAILQATYPHKKIYAVGEEAKGLKWLGKMEQSSPEMYQDALVIILDTANVERIDDRHFQLAKKTIKIDHHPNLDPFGDISWVNNDASSTSELIYDLFNGIKSWKLPDQAAKVLYAGIIGDTGRFKYPSTTAHTLSVASALVQYNFSPSEVNEKEDEIDLPLAHLSAYMYNNMKIRNGVYSIVLSKQLLKDFNLEGDSTAPVVALPGKIKSVVAWAIFLEQDDGTYRVRLRSKGPVINELARKYHGGGHPLASGAVVKDKSALSDFTTDLEKLTIAYQKEG